MWENNDVPKMAEMSAGEASEVLESTDFVEERVQDAIDYAASVLRKVAAGELREVVHGEWIDGGRDAEGHWITCSACGCDVRTEHSIFSFCPMCGAVMDGRDGD